MKTLRRLLLLLCLVVVGAQSVWADSGNIWFYSFNCDNAEVAAALGVDLRDPAVWQITICDTERFDVNRDGRISIADVTTLVNKILGKPTE